MRLCHGAGQHFRGGLYFDKLVNILKNVVCDKMSVAMKIDPGGNWKLIILMNCRLKVLNVFKHQKASLDGNTPRLFPQGLRGICCRTEVPFFLSIVH